MVAATECMEDSSEEVNQDAAAAHQNARRMEWNSR